MLLEKPIYVTEKGLADLQAELDNLRLVEWPAAVERLQESKYNTDFMDTSDTQLVQQELAFIEARIQELEFMLDHAELIETGPADNMVNIGETVVIQNAEGEIERYTIVGIAEADPGRGLISNESPLGKALLGHKVGEEVLVRAPAGLLRYRIMSVT